MTMTMTKSTAQMKPAARRFEPMVLGQEDPRGIAGIMTESGAVMHLFEVSVHCQLDEGMGDLARASSKLPVALHRSAELHELSAFAPMGAELYGLVHLDGVDAQKSLVRLSLRHDDGRVLFTWSVPLDFYLVADERGILRWRSLEGRMSMMERALRETLSRAEPLKGVAD